MENNLVKALEAVHWMKENEWTEEEIIAVVTIISTTGSIIPLLI